MAGSGKINPRAAAAKQRLEEAVQCQQLGRLKKAERLYRQVIDKHPNYLDANHLFGVFLFQQGRLEEALKALTRATAIDPRSTDVLNNLAFVLFRLNRETEALKTLEQALSIEPNNVQTLYNIACAYYDLKQPDKALLYYDRVVAAQPDYFPAWYNRALILSAQQRHDSALESLERALRIGPQVEEAHNQRGLVLFSLLRYSEALGSYDRALSINPGYALAHYNRGHLLMAMKRFDDALASFSRAYAIRPDYAEAHFSEAQCRLLTGDFERGWPKYEWRWEVEPQKNFKRRFSKPLWRGSDDIKGKTILIHYEQGFGDIIQFSRYVPLVARLEARVVMEVLAPIKGLLGSLAGVDLIVAHGEPLPPFDLHCPLASLPAAFGTRLETIPSQVPYLQANPENLRIWQERLGERRCPRIAINWGGYAKFSGDATRSIGLERMLPLLAAPGIEFVSIQKDLRPGDRTLLDRTPHLRHVGDQIDTFDDTAAIIALSDLLISSDTSVVHLAGALGRPAWVLLQFIPDWRWLLDREDSPWYPTLRLFRQREPGNWGGVIAEVTKALPGFVNSVAAR